MTDFIRTEEQEKNEVSEFELAFAEANGEVVKEVKETPDNTEEVEVPEEPVVEVEEPVEVEAEQSVPTEVPDEYQVKLEKAEATASSMKGRLKKTQAEFNEAQERIAALEEKLNNMQPAAQQQVDEPVVEVPDTFKEWEKEWSDFIAPIKYLISLHSLDEAKVEQLIERELGSVNDQLKTLSEYKEHSQVVESRNELDRAHPDWRTIKDDVLVWIETKGDPIAKEAYLTVYNNGTVEQTIALLDTYKKETRQPNNNKSKPKADKLQNMVNVSSFSSTPKESKGPDKNDYLAAAKEVGLL